MQWAGPQGAYARWVKPVLDVGFTLVLLPLLLPCCALLALLLALHFRTNPLFIQQRVGKHNQLFWLVKFRTMRTGYNTNGVLLPDGERLTRLGRWLRATSLDELPQVLHILSGHMSWIGPRPLLPAYLPLYNALQLQRHLVKPGITGWAQVHGRNHTTWPARLAQDVYYANHIHMGLDCKIVGLTLGYLLSGKGVSAAGSPTMPPFTGQA